MTFTLVNIYCGRQVSADELVHFIYPRSKDVQLDFTLAATLLTMIVWNKTPLVAVSWIFDDTVLIGICTSIYLLF